MLEKRVEKRANRPPLTVWVVDQTSLRSVEAKIHNFSKNGCCFELLSDFALSDRLGLQFENIQQMINARVAWRRGRVIGVTFIRQKLQGDCQRREKRIGVSIPALIWSRGDDWQSKCKIRNANSLGCRIEIDDPGELPDEVVIKIDAFKQPIAGSVKWRRGHSAGVEFDWCLAEDNSEKIDKLEKLIDDAFAVSKSPKSPSADTWEIL